ncbi:UPF0711 protein C18orf21 homolog [Ambystoma mexicanum]|uniref:UPF0711 protein C18orf21 homolog n=1 Tax=Ambystoma mexicanum TaxID=8296 RepID=UPI0037E82590
MPTDGVLQFLAVGAQELRERCPGEARHLQCTRTSLQESQGKPIDRRVCPFCFEILVPGNHTVRLKPKMKMTTQIRKLLKAEAKSCRLHLKQIKLLRKYKLSKSVLVVTCNLCKRSTKHPGETRSFLASNSPATPKARSGMTTTPQLKKTPSSGSKSNLSSPVVTPRSCSSGHPSPSVSSKSSKKSKFHFSRLKMLLTQDEKEKNKKGNLQNFLSAL